MHSPAYLKKEDMLAKPLRKQQVKLHKRLFNEQQNAAIRAAGTAEALQDRAVRQMEIEAASVEVQLMQLASAAKDVERGRRGFQAANRIMRPPRTPDVLKTLFIIMIGLVLEVIFAATGLFADGYVDLIPALGFALTFATANIGLGLAIGFTLRFVQYRSEAVLWSPAELTTRWIARIGLAAQAIVAMVMVFAGGRMRITGRHDGLFDFAAVPFGATFNDGLSLVIMIIAALSVALAAAKGFGGFFDPIPGYSDYVGAGGDIADEAQGLVEDALEEVAEIAEEAEEEILDAVAAPEDRVALFEDITRFNGRVVTAKADLAVLSRDEWQRRCFVAGEDLPQPEPDTALDALLIDPGELGNETAPPSLERLRNARTEANARISAAHTGFTARLSAIRNPSINAAA